MDTTPGIEIICDYACELAEGPLWHQDEGRLYWVDINCGRIYCYDPRTGEHQMVLDAGVAVGGFTIQEDGALLLFMDKGAVKRYHGGVLSTLLEEIPEERDSRFNDVCTDPLGGVFCGTIETAKHPGALYRLDPQGKCTRLFGEVGVSNGIGFSPDRKTMYYTDSPKQAIYRFDYDPGSGAISNRSILVQIPESLGSPDGMTVDADGYLWAAIWDGSCLIRFSPDGKEVQRFLFPAKKVSSLTFGGPEYEDVYVTTAGGENKAEEGPGAGAIFHLRPGVRGVPEFRSKIRVR
jgi:D-xylono/L-arabinono-1,4-lactonase